MTKEEQEAQEKAEEDKAKAVAEKAKQDGGDKQIAEFMKDPEAIKRLISERNSYFGESRKYLNDLNKFEKAKQEAEQKALEEQGKFKELSEKHKAEAEDLKKRFAGQRLDFELKLEAQAAGIIDAGDAVRLCDRAGLKLSDDFATVEGAKEAVEALKKTKPYLFAEAEGEKIPPPSIGRASLKGVPIKLDDSVHGVDRIAAGLASQKKK
jgi:hypothetical protein